MIHFNVKGYQLFSFSLILAFTCHFNHGLCPYELKGTPVSSSDETIPDAFVYNAALQSLKGNIRSLFDDLYRMMSDSQSCWPPDEFFDESKYNGLFTRLAWHCSGTYREHDGAGGCAGGRQRYEPEASWMDNVNLDKARALLYPIKEKYGNSLRFVVFV